MTGDSHAPRYPPNTVARSTPTWAEDPRMLGPSRPRIMTPIPLKSAPTTHPVARPRGRRGFAGLFGFIANLLVPGSLIASAYTIAIGAVVRCEVAHYPATDQALDHWKYHP